MYLQRCFVSAILIAGLYAVPAKACVYEPFLFQLPGETAEAAENRSSRILSDNEILRRADRENYAFKRAANIYLARKIATVEDRNGDARVTSVRPVGTIRGTAPTGTQMLRDESRSGRCATIGDGDISDLPAGAYVVVFDGLPRDSFRPRGIDSFSVNALRNGDLLDALTRFGKDPEE